MTVKEKKQPKGKGGARPGAGRKKIERPPEVRDEQFAARVLAHIGQPRWKRMYRAIEAHDAYPGLHATWRDAVFQCEHYPELLANWERRDKSERGKKPVEPKQPGVEPKQPPHPKELIENDEDLAIFYLVSHDAALANRTFINFVEKRDGKAMHNVNHLHDKPIEVNHTFKLAEEMREARLRVLEMRKKK